MSGFRFPIASVVLLVLSFVFFIIYAIMSFVLGVTGDMIGPMATRDLDATGAAAVNGIITELQTAFGVVCLALFIAGILVFFFFDVFRRDTDVYYYDNQEKW